MKLVEEPVSDDQCATTLEDESTLALGLAETAVAGMMSGERRRAIPTTPARHPSIGPGTVIKHYEIIRQLGAGGMGMVFLARDTRLARLVAVKFLLEHSGPAAQRFLAEARVTARCRHENIVVIYEVDEIHGTPYMVLEYLEGRTLRNWMAQRAAASEPPQRDSTPGPPPRDSMPGPLPPSVAVELIMPVVRALGCAHQLGIVHRDLKPENIVLTDGGLLKVLDFGIAKQVDAGQVSRATGETQMEHGTGVTQQGALIGTLPYMSPEQLRSEDLDHRSDLWAVGIILYELCTGVYPFEPFTRATLSRIANVDEPMPGVSAHRSDVGALGAVIDRCLKKRKTERFGSAEELCAALEPLLSGRMALELGEDESPFAGLAAFQESDASRFFGRENDIAAVIGKLRHQQLVTIAGPSGAGKSSFVRAGVIPALKRSGRHLEAFVLRPGRRPLAALADLLAQLSHTASSVDTSDEVDLDELAVSLRPGPGYLGTRLRARCREQGKDHRIILFVDQLEELYTLGIDPVERAAFCACLEGVADDAASPLRVVLTIRADFLDRLSDDRRFMAEVTRGLVFLPPIGREGLRDALKKPIEAAQYRFEGDDLVEEMLDGLAGTSSPLPLLQFTATKLWEARDRESKLLTRASYDKLGGVAGALSTHADAVLTGLSPSDQRLCRAVLLRLCTPERTRGIVRMDELCSLQSESGVVEQVVHHLADARLLSIETGGERDGKTVELAHESLIDRWATLRRWLDENEQHAQFLAQLRNAAQQWEKNDEAEGLLWRDRAAFDAGQWLDRRREEAGAGGMSGLGKREERYLQAVVDLAERTRRWRRRIAAGVIAALSVIAIVVSSLAIRAGEQARSANVARKKAEEAEQDAKRKAIEASDARLLAGFRELKNSGQLGWATKLLAEVQRPEEARGWIALAGDALGSNALEVTLAGHGKALRAAVWSQDGKRVLTASNDETARVWNASGWGDPIVLAGHEGPITSAEFGPGDQRVLTASVDGTARIWNADGRGVPVVLDAHAGPVRSAAFSPDGKRVVTLCADRSARVWNTDASHRIELKGHTGPLTIAVFLPDGERVLTASHDGTARIWSADGTGKPVLFKGHKAEVLFAAPNSDGTRIVTTSSDNTARIWNTSGKGKPVVLAGHERSILSAAWSADGTHIATASVDGTARVWSADGKGEPIVFFGHTQAVTSVAFRPDGRYIATASRDQTVRIWPAEGGTPLVLTGHEAPVRSVVWSSDGARLLTTRSDEGSSPDHAARIWHPARLESLRRERPRVLHSAFIGTGGYLAVSAYDDDTVRLWHVDGSGETKVFKRHDAWVASAALSPDGTRIASVSFDKTARIIRADGTGESVVLQGHTAAVRGAAFSPDGSRLATVSDDRTARVWPADGKAAPVVLSGHADALASAAWSPDGARIVTTSLDHTARLWRADGSGTPVVLEGHGGSVYAAAWSPDGTRIVTASEDGTAQVWNADSGAPTLQLAHGSPVLSAIWSPDGAYIATSLRGSGLRVWAADGMGEPLSLEAPTPVIAMAFLEGGQRILTVAPDHTTRTFTIDVGALKRGLAAANADCLPSDMRATYFGEPPDKAWEHYEACERAHQRSPVLTEGKQR